MTMIVTVRDATGNVVLFTDNAASPTGEATFELNAGNHFAKQLLLPAGDYTFETRVKDLVTRTALLGYGPAAENTLNVSSAGVTDVLRLKFHAVTNPTASSLITRKSGPYLYTGTRLNVSLDLRTASDTFQTAGVPSADAGNVTFTLADSTDGVILGSSKTGASIRVGGSPTDQELNLQVQTTAWQADPGGETASLQPLTLNIAEPIMMVQPNVDTSEPYVGVNNPRMSDDGTALVFTGMGSDDVELTYLRLFINHELVGSTSFDDQLNGVSSLEIDGAGDWTITVPRLEPGSHSAYVIGEDSSGNEGRHEINFEVGADGKPVMPIILN